MSDAAAATVQAIDRDPVAIAEGLIRRGRAAMEAFEDSTQARVDEAVTAIAWSLYKPEHAEALARMAVEDTGIGNAPDKVIKNQRKTFGTLRDLLRVRSVGIIEELPELGLVKYAKPVGVVGAVTPSTNPAATPVNKAMMALKGRNAIIIAPSPAGLATTTRTVNLMRAELAKIGAPADLVQVLPPPVDKPLTNGADGRVRPRGRHRLAEQRPQRLPQRHAGDRGRRGERPGHHRFEREARRGGGERFAGRSASTTRRRARRRTRW